MIAIVLAVISIRPAAVAATIAIAFLAMKVRAREHRVSFTRGRSSWSAKSHTRRCRRSTCDCRSSKKRVDARSRAASLPAVQRWSLRRQIGQIRRFVCFRRVQELFHYCLGCLHPTRRHSSDSVELIGARTPCSHKQHHERTG